MSSYSAEGGVKWIKNAYGQGVHAGNVSGKFSKEESEKVRTAVKSYCAEKGISVARLCSECDHKAELKGAWMEIAKALPDRSVQSVYRHGLRQLHPFKRGIWSDEECDALEVLVSQIGKKWATIQDKLNRSADSCRDKYREMDDVFIRGRWKESEKELLQRIVREFLKVDPSADIKELGRMVRAKNIKIPWSMVSKRMVNRSRLSCFKKWQKMAGIYRLDQLKPPATSIDSKSPKEPPARRTKTTTTPAVAHTAPTAGAAAAMVSSGGAAIVGGGIAQTDADSDLLTELVGLDASRMSDVDWGSLKVPNAQERWFELFEELQASADDTVLSMPLSSVAQVILDRKASAQQAAETVEAVDLPNI